MFLFFNCVGNVGNWILRGKNNGTILGVSRVYDDAHTLTRQSKHIEDELD